MRFLLGGPDTVGLLHADPHPGNFRLLPDGRLGVMDFGAVNRLPHGLPPAMGELVTLALCGDGAAFVEGLRDEGFIKPTMRIDGDELLRYLDPVIEPVRHREHTFTREWLRRVSTQMSDVTKPDWLLATRINLPPAYLLIQRVWLGGLGVLAQLEASVPAREIILEAFPGVRHDLLPPVE